MTDANQVPPPALGAGEQQHLLAALVHAITMMRASEGRLTIAGLHALLFLAQQTADRDRLDLPTTKDFADALHISISGASRLLASLSAEGRVRPGSDAEGLNLVETDDFGEGRNAGRFILTDRGREMVVHLMQSVSGRRVEGFNPHDRDGLFRALIANFDEKKLK